MIGSRPPRHLAQPVANHFDAIISHESFKVDSLSKVLQNGISSQLSPNPTGFRSRAFGLSSFSPKVPKTDSTNYHLAVASSSSSSSSSSIAAADAAVSPNKSNINLVKSNMRA